MGSPLVERYLQAKLAQPEQLVLASSGAFWVAFVEDAQLLGRELGLWARDLAAEAGPERIIMCGIPKARLESAIERLGGAGWEVHVE